MAEQQITVEEFLKVRQHVATLLKQDSQTQGPTRIRQAENLMAAGAIDVQAVLERLRPEPETQKYERDEP